ncbi:MAG: hypothetical protein Fur0024_4030 [Patescibacteria group bacterium]
MGFFRKSFKKNYSKKNKTQNDRIVTSNFLNSSCNDIFESQEEDEKKVKNYIYRLLLKRDYAIKNIKFKILQKFPNFSRIKIEEILNEFSEKNYLDDERFAENYMRSLLARGRGEQKAREFLFSKGVSESLINKILQKIFTKSATEEAVLKILQQKFGIENFQVFKSLNFEEKQKIKIFLARRGFVRLEI